MDFSCCGLRGQLILARRDDEFSEFQSQLLDQPGRALGARPVKFTFELLDPQLKDARISASLSDSSARALAASACQLMAFGLDLSDLRRRDGIAFDLDPQPRFAFSLQRLTFDQQCRLGAGKIRRGRSSGFKLMKPVNPISR